MAQRTGLGFDDRRGVRDAAERIAGSRHVKEKLLALAFSPVAEQEGVQIFSRKNLIWHRIACRVLASFFDFI